MHGFHRLRVARVVTETADASSLVLDVPAALADAFAYEAGQFCTFRATIGGEHHQRCYSMSSAPAVDGELAVTVKRVPGGLVSNHLLDTLAAGDEVEVSEPAGRFRLPDGDAPLVAFAAGSGITPVFSLLKQALATTKRSVRLLYANRDRDATIFAAELDALAGPRLEVVHRLDVEDGFLDAAAAASFLGDDADVDAFVCGPAPFMEVAEDALLAAGVDAGRVHVERFTPAAIPDEPSGPSTVVVELNGTRKEGEHRAGTTVLQMARQLGLAPPYSCESGSCATCMARLVDGTVKMFVNDALTEDEVADGWILTCQSVPTSPAVHVVYEGG